MTSIESALQFLRDNGHGEAADIFSARWTLADYHRARAERYRASLRKIGRKYRDTLLELREYRRTLDRCIYCGSDILAYNVESVDCIDCGKVQP